MNNMVPGYKAAGYVSYPGGILQGITRTTLNGSTVYFDAKSRFYMIANTTGPAHSGAFIRIVPLRQDPKSMTTNVNGKRVKVSDITIKNKQAVLDGEVIASINASGALLAMNGSALVAAGGGNIISHDGGGLVAAGGGNLVAAGGGNLVAAGGGNIISHDGGGLVAAGGGNLHWNLPG